MTIKLLALDMDGTTYYKGGTIVPANVEPIKEALDQGVEVVIVTGRPALAEPNQLKENGFDKNNALIAACNGACIYNFNENKLIESNPIPANIAEKIFNLTFEERFKDIELWGYVDDLETSVINRESNHTPGYIFESQFFDGNFKYYENSNDDFSYNCFKVLGFNVFNDEFIEELNKLGLESALNKNEGTVEINAKGINKAFAVKWLAENLKINNDEIMAIGDGMNDLPMIQYAGWGVSLENSIQEVKDAAKIHINKTNEEGGVAEAIYQYVLKK